MSSAICAFMKTLWSILLITILSSLALADKYTEITGLPPVPTYTIQKTKDKISVDGKLSEKGWAKAKSVTLMYPWDFQTGAKQLTTVKLLSDQDFLYVGYECVDNDITAILEKRDDPVYKDDCVEIFINTNPAADHYFGFEMNATGVLYDYFYSYPQKHDMTPNLDGILLKTEMRGTLNQPTDQDRGWTLEVAIPFKSLNATPKKGDQWKIQLNRWDGTEPNRRLSMWSNSGMKKANPHNPERFGKLFFK